LEREGRAGVTTVSTQVKRSARNASASGLSLNHGTMFLAWRFKAVGLFGSNTPCGPQEPRVLEMCCRLWQADSCGKQTVPHGIGDVHPSRASTRGPDYHDGRNSVMSPDLSELSSTFCIDPNLAREVTIRWVDSKPCRLWRDRLGINRVGTEYSRTLAPIFSANEDSCNNGQD
jgi:hypothetical protein